MTHPENRLAGESSPYLLQHARNPVDWHPWGPEALEKARRENKPIFLSIGYSACHWCHVMERESFEDPETAKVMNAHFVNIKVDREERPDLDEIYMQAVMMMTGSGGWPMSVWLTPALEPFYGGTYFPPGNQYGRPGFRNVLEGLAKAYHDQPVEVARTATQLVQGIRDHTALPAPGETLTAEPLQKAAAGLARQFDPEFGGFGDAPKFPPSMDLEVLLRVHLAKPDPAVLAMVETTLDRMARGGMNDQLGGGFHRYSTDDKWLIPHFEKMLYDNALLARVYLHAWQATGKAAWAGVVRATCDYVLREMTSPEGGFYSAQDADSEGEEGKFFAWTPAEVEAAIGKEDAVLFCRTYDVTAAGNFEHGKSALWLPQPISAELEAKLAPMRAKLLAVREKRVKPGRDEKILSAWNGLMVRALAEAGAALGESRYLDAARRAADFCLTRMMRGGRLLHTYGRGEAKLMAYLDDHAYLAAGCLALFEGTGEGRWLASAEDLAALMVAHFRDASGGAFFYTADDHEALIARTKHLGDNALPSGNSVAAMVFLRLGILTGKAACRTEGEGAVRAFSAYLGRSPRGFSEMLCALDQALAEPVEIVVAGAAGDPGTRALLAKVRGRFQPNAVLVPFDPASGLKLDLTEGRGPVRGRPVAYVCRGGTCRLPVSDPSEL